MNAAAGEYISKKALEDIIKAECYIPTNGTVVLTDVTAILRMVKEMPTANVAPVRTGHWILSKEQDPAYTAEGHFAYICSKCGATDIHAEDAKVSYCWNCGAEMNEGEEHGDK